MKKDPYKTLGVASQAGEREIRRAHRSLAKRFHPDAGEGASEERFRDVQDAYSILIDPQRRAAYDRAVRDEHRTERPATVPSGITHARRRSHVDLTDVFRRPAAEFVSAPREADVVRFPGAVPDGVGLLLDLLAEWPEFDDPCRLRRAVVQRRKR